LVTLIARNLLEAEFFWNAREARCRVRAGIFHRAIAALATRDHEQKTDEISEQRSAWFLSQENID